MVEAGSVETDNEIKLLKEVKNKSHYIIEYFDDFSFLIFRCIITEFCPNGDLDGCIAEKKSKQHKFRSNQITFWCSDIIQGLVFLHDKDIIHRDIKPK